MRFFSLRENKTIFIPLKSVNKNSIFFKIQSSHFIRAKKRNARFFFARRKFGAKNYEISHLWSAKRKKSSVKRKQLYHASPDFSQLFVLQKCIRRKKKRPLGCREMRKRRMRPHQIGYLRRRTISVGVYSQYDFIMRILFSMLQCPLPVICACRTVANRWVCLTFVYRYFKYYIVLSVLIWI